MRKILQKIINSFLVVYLVLSSGLLQLLPTIIAATTNDPMLVIQPVDQDMSSNTQWDIQTNTEQRAVKSQKITLSFPSEELPISQVDLIVGGKSESLTITHDFAAYQKAIQQYQRYIAEKEQYESDLKAYQEQNAAREESNQNEAVAKQQYEKHYKLIKKL